MQGSGSLIGPRSAALGELCACHNVRSDDVANIRHHSASSSHICRVAHSPFEGAERRRYREKGVSHDVIAHRCGCLKVVEVVNSVMLQAVLGLPVADDEDDELKAAIVYCCFGRSVSG
jgi:hypothetical protein